MDNQKLVTLGIAAGIGVVALGTLYYLYSGDSSESGDNSGENQETNEINDGAEQNSDSTFGSWEPTSENDGTKRRRPSYADDEGDEAKRRKLDAEAEAKKKRAQKAKEEEEQREAQKRAAQRREQEEQKKRAAKRKADAEAQAEAEAERQRRLNAVKPIQPLARADKKAQIAASALFKSDLSANVAQPEPTKRKLRVHLRGDGLDSTKLHLGKLASFTLQVEDSDDKPVDFAENDVGFEIAGGKSEKAFKKTAPGVFTMQWRPLKAGRYVLSFTITGKAVGKNYTFDIKE